VKKGKAKASMADFKKQVMDLWFGLYRRKVPNDSSGVRSTKKKLATHRPP
jgi:hypothetical protein